MTLRYADRREIDAVLLSRTDGKMRVALKGSDDITELTEVSGAWVTDDCEPVQVRFAYQKPSPVPTSEEDYICSPELAAKLMHLLRSADESEESSQTPAMTKQELAVAAMRVV
jgi:hypothetical protein